MIARPFPRGVMRMVRFAISGILLVAISRVLDYGEVFERLRALDGNWVALGLGISVVQVVLLAWRWRFTAGRLGIDLPLRTAVREYYLSILLNQLLPGGVSGDVSRAWRQTRSPAPAGPTVRAVILERASGQLVMTSVALMSLLALPMSSGITWTAVGLVGLVTAAAVGVRAARRAAPDSLMGRTWADTHEGLLAPGALPIQFASGLLAVASYIGLFLVAARAIGVDTEIGLLLPLVAPVLMTMLIPVTVAGWGIREGAAAALWSFVGLTPEDGVAISVAYGLLVLVSSAPGVLALMQILLGDRDRTTDPDRGRNDGTSAEAPYRESESEPG